MSNLSSSGLPRVLNYLKTWVTNLLSSKANTNHSHAWNDIDSKPSFANVATSGSYNDLSNKPTIPTVNNATLTIQKNSSNVATFTANASSNVTANISVPTKVSELTNDSGFLTAHQSLSNYSTLANTVKSLSISGKTITVTPGSGSAYTLTTQDTTYTHPTSSGNKHIPSGGSSGQFLGWSADGTAKWVNNPNTNTWTAMVGATSSANGSVGYVNTVPPKDGYNTKYLRADGTWQVPPDHTYTVNNATLTIQKNGTTVKTFTANASSNVTANITVPTKTSELTNDSFVNRGNNNNGIILTWNSPTTSYVNLKVDTTEMGGIITHLKLMYINGDRANNTYRIVYGGFNNSNNVSTGRHRVTFPNAFSSAPIVMLTLQNPDGIYNYQISNITKTSFIAEIWDGSGNRTSNGVAAGYIAIGNS